MGVGFGMRPATAMVMAHLKLMEDTKRPIVLLMNFIKVQFQPDYILIIFVVFDVVLIRII